jgi:hypothetical protein
MVSRSLARRASALLLLWLAAGALAAHELEANRLTLVLRERNHLSLMFYLDISDVLYRILSPKRPFQEFVLVHAAMKPQDFQKAFLHAQAKIQADTRLTLADGREAAITQWAWPDPARVQAALQERAMAAVVAPADHDHGAPLEIRAEAMAGRDIDAVSVRLPEEFRQVLIVSYRPAQAWAAPGAPAPLIRFVQ